MQTVDLLRFQIQLTKDMTTPLLADMLDAPMEFPTPNGGNHPTWVAGHLTYSESNLIHHVLIGDTNPLIAWKAIFGAGSQPTAAAAHYPPLSDLLAQWDEVRAHTMRVLDTLSDDDLDKASVSPPAGREAVFGTYGKVFSMVGLHPLMHRGQVSDARRAKGRKHLMA
jgi:hypothetical protein